MLESRVEVAERKADLVADALCAVYRAGSKSVRAELGPYLVQLGRLTPEELEGSAEAAA